MIVADASLITSFAVRDGNSDLADAVFEADGNWVAPLLWRYEVRGALVRYMNHAGLNLEAALLAFHTAEEVVAGREYKVSSERVLELAVRSKCAANDCEYIALAEELDVLLVTPDRQIVKAFPKIAVSLENFARKKK